ncbi:hypothetical protein [Candidatus Methanomethylophilus sp. 1R26]|uniref:hypothetical protein n=1 Tax=Candidatus Methanomethylophilus sp. 1R26 TaxID=1769296 RepID=UPI001F36D2AA|nr:hypothetical protein [Candidatus Methanomethylophilus sp. 1R26]
MNSSLDQYFLPSVVDYFMLQWPFGQLVAVDPLGRIVGYLAGAVSGRGERTSPCSASILPAAAEG